MGIQNNINQTISLLGLISPHTPMAEAQKKRTKIKELKKNISTAHSFAGEAFQPIERMREAGASAEEITSSPEYETYLQASETASNLYGELARLEPNEGNIRGMTSFSREANTRDFGEYYESTAVESLENENRRIEDSNTITAAISEPIVREAEERPRIGVTEVR